MNALTELRITREAGEDAHAYAVHVERLEAQLAAEQRRSERLASELDHANIALASMESVMEDATLYIQLLRRRVADLEVHAEVGTGLCAACRGSAAAHSQSSAWAGRQGGASCGAYRPAGRGYDGFSSYGGAEPAGGGAAGGWERDSWNGGWDGSAAAPSSSSSDPISMPAIRKQIHAAVTGTEGMPEAQRKQRITALRLRRGNPPRAATPFALPLPDTPIVHPAATLRLFASV